MTADAEMALPLRITAGIERAHTHIATMGTNWTGAQRLQIAAVARSAVAGEELPASELLTTAARDTAAKIAAHAHVITASDVDAFDNPAAFVEIVGVVARSTAIDTVVRGVGAPVIPFPSGTREPPSGHVDPNARRRAAWVPMVGGAGPTTALSAVPAEDAAQADLHGALYLSYAEMADLTIRKGLPRWQLELVAARTSLINHCRF